MLQSTGNPADSSAYPNADESALEGPSTHRYSSRTSPSYPPWLHGRYPLQRYYEGSDFLLALRSTEEDLNT